MPKLAILIFWASFYTLANNAVIDLYPLKAAEYSISKSMIGQVLGIYSISGFISLPLSMWMLKRCSDLLVYQIGLIMVFLALVLVALLPLFESASVFLALSFLFRIFQGASDIMLNMSTINMIQKAPNKDFYLNLLTGCLSIGAALGPFLVSMLEESLGFSGFYFSLSGLVLASACICRFLNTYFTYPTSKKQELLETHSQSDTAASLTDRFTLEVTEQEYVDLSPLDILKIKNVAIGLLFFVTVASLWNFRDPILPLHLKERGLKNATISYFYLMQRVTNALFGLAPLLFVKRAAPRTVIIAGSVGIALSQFLVGPSSMLGLGHSLTLILVGQALLGASFNFAVSPLMPYLLNSIKEQYPSISNPEKLSLLYLAGRSLGYWIGPFLGSILYGQFDFAFTCDLFGLSFVIMTCIFSNLLCAIPQIFRSCRRKDKFVLEDSYRELNGGAEANSYI